MSGSDNAGTAGRFDHFIIRHVVLDLIIHALVSSILALILLRAGAGWGPALLCMTVGLVLVDLDHLLDCAIYLIGQQRSINLENFLKAEYIRSGKVYFIFHSWEIIAPLIIMGLILARDGWYIWGAALGFFGHMLVDQIHNAGWTWSYFLIYRWKKKFAMEGILLPERAQYIREQWGEQGGGKAGDGSKASKPPPEKKP